MKQLYKTGLLLMAVLASAVFAQTYAENTLNKARIYINPGHGGWGSNDRPLPTINYVIMDTLGFFETKTSLWQGESLRDELKNAGAGYIRMSRTKNGIAPKSQATLFPHEQYEDAEQLSTLSVIARDVQENNMDYFISLHSNAHTDGSTTNYPLLLYRGTDNEVGNDLKDARQMAMDTWKYLAKEGVSYYSAYTSASSNNTRGDISFYGKSTTVDGFTGYLGVLKHGCDGYLGETCFHTYQPERHRMLNRDYTYELGLRYSRAIRAWFGDNTETKGYIVGTVKDKNEALDHALYKYKVGSFDAHKPLNEVVVKLQSESGVELASYKTDKEYNGVYVFKKLSPGKYKLVYDIEGYWKEEQLIEVKANETSFINKLLTDKSKPEPGTEEQSLAEVDYYTHPKQDGDIAGASSYNIVADGSVSNFPALNGLTVRRAILRFGKYYVLAVDNDKKPKLLVLNPADGSLIKEMSTTGIVTEGYNGKTYPYVLSDIAFTNDTVLIGVNSTVIGKKDNKYQTGDFYMYKWQAAEGKTFEEVDPQVLLKLETNHNTNILLAGYNNSNLMANSIALNGKLNDFRFYFDSHAGAGWNTQYGIRYMLWFVKNGKVIDYQYNDTDWDESQLGEDVRITLSPTAVDHLIIDGKTIKPREFKIETKATQISSLKEFNEAVPVEANGANYFRYADRLYMSAPVFEKQGDNTYSYKVSLFDITKGFDKAMNLGSTPTLISNEAALSPMTAHGVVDNADIDLYLLVGNKGAKATTRGAAQTPSPARIFAYGLNASYSAAEKAFKIKFALNENANQVDLILYKLSGEEAKVISLGAKTKGQHETRLADADIPENEGFRWGIRASAGSVTRLTKLSDDSAVYKFFAPKGVAIDKSTESEYFGRVYVSNTMPGEVGGRATTTGVYILAPDASDVSSQGNNAHNGGIAWSNKNAEGPRKLAVAADGRVFLSDASASNSGIYVMNPKNYSMAPMFTGVTRDEKGVLKAGSTFVCGQVIAIGTRGEGKNTQVFAVDQSASGNNWKKITNVYNIGNENTWSAAPSYAAMGSSYVGNGNASVVPVSTGYWAAQYRGKGSNTVGNPCMLYYSDKHKEAVFNTAEFKDKNGEPIIQEASENGGLAVDESRNLIALSYNGGVYVFEYKINKNGIPNVTPKFKHAFDVSATSYDDFAFDYAGNLYALSNKSKQMSVWAMPITENTCTTPAMKSSLVARGNMVYPGVTNLKAEVSGKQVTLTWDKPAGVTAEVKYKVYCQGELLATVAEQSYVHKDLATGEYKYSVTALVGSYETEAAYANAVIVLTKLEEPRFSCVSYPNPADAFVTIESTESINSVAIFDLSGKMLREVTGLNSNKETLDVSALRPGVYLMRVNKTSVLRLVRK